MTLELRNVSKRFPGVLAVDDVSFSAPAGEITGYLGPNGSGKSTTMKMIAGLIEIGSGEILFGGEPIRHDLIAHKRRTGYVPEEPHLYAHLSGLEYLTMVGQFEILALQAHRGTHRRPAAPAVSPLRPPLAHLGLFERHAPEDSARRRAAARSRLLLLDEPFSGLDVSSALILRSLVGELAARGKVILFSSHELETVERVSAPWSSCTAAK